MTQKQSVFPKLLLDLDGRSHIPALDGLRGIAIALVLLYHYLYITLKIDFGLFEFGWMGVDLFFVLSGFLITRILIANKNQPDYYSSFYRNRTLRIFPLYYGFLILFFLVAPLIWKQRYFDDFRFVYDHQAWFWTYTQNILMSFHGWPKREILNPTWSLAIEEQFYLLWPLMVRITSLRSLEKVSAAIILTSVVFRHYCTDLGMDRIGHYIFTISRMDSLAMGSIVAVWITLPERRKLLEYLSARMIIFIVFYTATLVFFGRAGSSFMFQIGYTFNAVLFAFVLLLAISRHPDNRFASVLNVRPLKFLGRYSYGIYLFHVPVMFLYEAFVPSQGVPLVVNMLIQVTVTLLISYISFHVYEKWFLKLKKKSFQTGRI